MTRTWAARRARHETGRPEHDPRGAEGGGHRLEGGRPPHVGAKAKTERLCEHYERGIGCERDRDRPGPGFGDGGCESDETGVDGGVAGDHEDRQRDGVPAEQPVGEDSPIPRLRRLVAGPRRQRLRPGPGTVSLGVENRRRPSARKRARPRRPGWSSRPRGRWRRSSPDRGRGRRARRRSPPMPSPRFRAGSCGRRRGG